MANKDNHSELYSIIIDTNQKNIALNDFEKTLIELTDGEREDVYLKGEFIKDVSEIGFYNFYVDDDKDFAERMVDALKQKGINAFILTDRELDEFWDERDDMRNDEETIKIVFKDQTLNIKLFPVTEEEAAE